MILLFYNLFLHPLISSFFFKYQHCFCHQSFNKTLRIPLTWSIYTPESVFQLDIETSFSNFIHLLLSKWVITYNINVCGILYVWRLLCGCVCVYVVCAYFLVIQSLYSCNTRGKIIWNTKWKGVKKGFNWYI